MIDKIVFSIVFAANIYTSSELKSVDTQVIHTEPMVVLDEGVDFYKVLANGTDTGFVKKIDVIPFEPLSNIKRIDSLKAHIYRLPNVYEEPPLISLPYGAQVEYLGEKQNRWMKIAYLCREGKGEGWIQEKDVVETFSLLDADSSVTFAERFLERPYTWGGLSSDGLDCSGLVKVVLQRRNVMAPHSASKQALMGEMIEKNDLRRGDLVFFKRNDKIVHVGIYRGDGTFIHASSHETGRPAVRINRLDEPIWQELYATSRRL